VCVYTYIQAQLDEMAMQHEQLKVRMEEMESRHTDTQFQSPASCHTHPDVTEAEAGIHAQLEALQNKVVEMYNTLRGKDEEIQHKEEEIAGLHARISEQRKDLDCKDAELLAEKEKFENEKKAAVQTAKEQSKKKNDFFEQRNKDLQDDNVKLQEDNAKLLLELENHKEELKKAQESLNHFQCALKLEKDKVKKANTYIFYFERKHRYTCIHRYTHTPYACARARTHTLMHTHITAATAKSRRAAPQGAITARTHAARGMEAHFSGPGRSRTLPFHRSRI
jgi:DNA repair exonuclease SbcCD ATPase subunit